MNASSRFALALALVLAAAALAHWPILGAWFAADDFLWLERSEWSELGSALTGPWGHGDAWRPLARASLLLDAKLYGSTAFGWHLTNLGVHLGVSALLAILVRRLTGDGVPAVASAALFALSPALHQNTMWISGRTHSLAAAGMLASLLALDRYLERGSLVALGAAAAATLAALLCYEVAAISPALAAMLGLWHRRLEPDRGTRAALATAAIGLLTLGWALARAAALEGSELYPTRPPSFASIAVLVQAMATPLEPLLPSALLLPLGIAIGATRSDLQRMLVGLLLALVCLLPFMVIHGFAPRFLYAASLGSSLALAVALVATSRIAPLGRPVALLIAVLMLGGAGLETRRVARGWAECGELGRASLALLEPVSERAGADRPWLVLSPLRTCGRGYLFFTHFDAAVRRFVPGRRGAVFDDDGLRPYPRAAAVGRERWQRERARREDEGLPPFDCPRFVAGLGHEMPSALAGELIDCGALVLGYSQDGMQLRSLERGEVLNRLQALEAKHAEMWAKLAASHGDPREPR